MVPDSVIHAFIHLVNEYLLNFYYVPNTHMCLCICIYNWDTAKNKMNKGDDPCPHVDEVLAEVGLSSKKARTLQVRKMHSVFTCDESFGQKSRAKGPGVGCRWAALLLREAFQRLRALPPSLLPR